MLVRFWTHFGNQNRRKIDSKTQWSQDAQRNATCTAKEKDQEAVPPTNPPTHPPFGPPRTTPGCPRGRAGKGLPCENTTITTMSNRRSIILQRRRSAAPRKDFEDPFVENPLPLGIEFELRRRSITPSLRHYDNENGMEVAKPQRGAKMSNRPSLR